MKVTSSSSEDVIHDFGLPAFRHQDRRAARAVRRALWYQPTQLGEYHMFCDQYCGTWHSLMVGKVKVVPPGRVRREFLDRVQAGSRGRRNPVDGSLGVREGMAAVPCKLQCIELPHAAEAGSGTRGPRCWRGCTARKCRSRAAGRVRPRRRGVPPGVDPATRTLKVVRGVGADGDAGELRAAQVSEEDLNKLVAYIRWLKKGDTPQAERELPGPGRRAARVPAVRSPTRGVRSYMSIAPRRRRRAAGRAGTRPSRR